jgi:cell division protein FtsZ
MEHINGKCANAQVIMGAAMDPNFQDRLAVTIIATSQGESLLRKPSLNESARDTMSERGDALDTQPDYTTDTRPTSRMVPPPPAMSVEMMEQNAEPRRPGFGRGRKGPRFLQTQLPLEIISKGRFDKSEPTIHKGEDLDVPTYIRRGVALN